MRNNGSINELVRLFLKLGIIGFGGPAVHISMMEEEVVRKRKWMSHQHFLDLVGATNLIPGPNSTEMVMHIGHERAGGKGLVVAGLCFIMPAVILTAILAWLYSLYGKLPEVQPFLYGIKPAVIAIIINAMFILGRKALKTIQLGIIGLLSAAAVIVGVNEIIVLFTAGFIGILIFILSNRRAFLNTIFPFILLQVVYPPGYNGMKLFLIFLKVGALLYGSGYVLFAFLDAELVTKGWLSKQQLIDSIAAGQFTPGPVFSSATFIGWQVGGLGGAVAATIGIFLPSFLFVALLNPIIPKLRNSKVMAAFLDTVNVASIAIILAVVLEMGKESMNDWRTILIAVLSLAASVYFKKLNSAFIVVSGSIAGYLLWLI